MRNTSFSKNHLILIAISLISFYFFLIKPKNIIAQGNISCYNLQSGTGVQCKTLFRNCEPGYISPPGECEIYRGTECPLLLDCIPSDIAATPRPTSTVSPDSCNNAGDRCCGTIPPLYCGPGLMPSNPNDTITCVCQDQPIPISTSYSCTTTGGEKGVNTALGCIPIVSVANFAAWAIRTLIFVASGVAFLLMAFATFQIVTSSGDAKKVQAGKETLTSAVAGLIFIILSVLLLKLIGVDILHLPSF